MTISFSQRRGSYPRKAQTSEANSLTKKLENHFRKRKLISLSPKDSRKVRVFISAANVKRLLRTVQLRAVILFKTTSTNHTWSMTSSTT